MGNQIQIRVRRGRARSAPLVSRLVSLLGCALTFQSTPAAAQGRLAVPPSRLSSPAAPPWSAAGGGSELRPARARVTSLPPVRHRAIHTPSVIASPPAALFPRAGDNLSRRRAREEAMRRHPAGGAIAQEASGVVAESSTRVTEPEGKSVGRPVDATPGVRQPIATTAPAPAKSHGGCRDQIKVKAGDTLWDIGRAVIHSDDDAEIAAYVHRVHAANRDAIGDDPDLIFPGQRLQLPDCER